MTRQLELFVAANAKRGSRRGRRPRPERVGFVPHVTRPTHEWKHPVHVTIRRVANAPNLRAQSVYAAIERELTALKARYGRLIHFSIQADHIHLMVESHDRKTLSRQMQLLFSRIARSVNRVARRRGSLFRDRHHRHDLRTPTETRRALVYILFNTRKHAVGYQWMDPHCSMRWFDGWAPERAPGQGLLKRLGPGAPVTEPRTWLASVGWRRAGGPVRFDESPTMSA